MFEIICASALILSTNVYHNIELNSVASSEKAQGLSAIERNSKSGSGSLAEIVANESKYRREADREGERHEVESPEEVRERDRIYRDADLRRREEISPEERDRIQRDAELRRHEEASPLERIRIYRNENHRREEVFPRERGRIYRDRHHHREAH